MRCGYSGVVYVAVLVVRADLTDHSSRSDITDYSSVVVVIKKRVVWDVKIYPVFRL